MTGPLPHRNSVQSEERVEAQTSISSLRLPRQTMPLATWVRQVLPLEFYFQATAKLSPFFSAPRPLGLQFPALLPHDTSQESTQRRGSLIGVGEIVSVVPSFLQRLFLECKLFPVDQTNLFFNASASIPMGATPQPSAPQPTLPAPFLA